MKFSGIIKAAERRQVRNDAEMLLDRLRRARAGQRAAKDAVSFARGRLDAACRDMEAADQAARDAFDAIGAATDAAE